MGIVHAGALLVSQRRLDTLLDAAPTTDATDEEQEKDVLCKTKLQLHVACPLKAVVDRATTARDAWVALHGSMWGR